MASKEFVMEKGHFDGRTGGSFNRSSSPTEIVYQPGPRNWKHNTFVTSSAVQFKNDTCKISVNIVGNCVVRIGLSKSQPVAGNDIESFQKESIFEYEEGVHNSAKWTLFRTRYKKIGFSRSDTKVSDADKDVREYVCKEKKEAPEQMWIYIMVVYGKPRATLQTVEQKQILKLLRLEDNKKVIDKDPLPVERNTVTTCMHEAVQHGRVYRLKWKMRLFNESFAGTHPKHGLFTFGFIRKKEKLENISDKSTSVVEIESPVEFSQFADVVAFNITHHTIANCEITHNLLMQSAGQTLTRDLSSGFFRKDMFLYMKFSSGEISIEHGPVKNEKQPDGLMVQQELGPIILFDNVSKIKDAKSLSLKMESLTKSQPKFIYFGPSPVMFITQFGNCPVDVITETARTLGEDVIFAQLPKTDAIQVHGIEEKATDNRTEYDIKNYFTNAAHGGGKIKTKGIQRKRDGCWIVEFEDKNVAQSILASKDHFVGRAMVQVLPYFKELGEAIDGDGSIPIFDLEPFEFQIRADRKLAVEFLLEYEDEACKFKTALMEKGFKAELIRKEKCNIQSKSAESDTDSDDEDDDDEDDESEEKQFSYNISVTCCIPESDFERTSIWKKSVSKILEDYLKETIQSETVEVKKEYMTDTRKLLLKYKTKATFCFAIDNYKVTLVAADQTLLREISSEIRKVPALIKETLQLDIQDVQFNVLKAERYIEKLQKKYPLVSFGNTRLQGPHEEVAAAKSEILSAAMLIQEIPVVLTENQKAVMKSSRGKHEMKTKLKSGDFVQDFSIDDNTNEIMIYIYCETNEIKEKKREQIKNAVAAIVVNKDLHFQNADVSNFQGSKWEQFISDLRSSADDIQVTVLPNEKIAVIGTPTSIQEFERRCRLYIEGRHNLVDSLSIDKLKYLHRSGKLSDNVRFDTDQFGFTGKIRYIEEQKGVETLKSKMREKIKHICTEWFYKEFPWIAKASYDIPQTLGQCIVKVETGSSLAQNCVKCVAFQKEQRAAILVKVCDIALEMVDICVIPSDDSGHSPIAAHVKLQAGDEMVHNFMEEVDGKQPRIGDIVVTCPGNLRCMRLIHAVRQKGWNGQHNNINELVKKCFQVAEKESASSIAFTALWTCGDNLNEKCEVFIKALDTYLSNPLSTLKEVYFCGDEYVTNAISKSLGKLDVKNWFIFTHGIELPLSNLKTPKVSEEASGYESKQAQGRPPTAKRFGRGNTKHDMPDEVYRPIPEESSDGDGLYPSSEDEHIIAGDETIRLKEMTVHIVRGDIASQKADVIVATTGQFPELYGAIANAIKRKGGPTIVEECKQHTGKVSFGDIVPTGPGNLRCSLLYHILLKPWDAHEGENFIRKVVDDCLREASGSKHSSIAFPGLGTGQFGYPSSTVARAMIKGVKSFETLNHGSKLKDVYFVLFDEPTWKNFREVASETNTGSIPTGLSNRLRDKQRMRETARHGTGKRVLPFNVWVDSPYRPPRIPGERSRNDDVVFFRLIHENKEDMNAEIRKLLADLVTTKTVNLTTSLKDEPLLPTEIGQLERCSTIGCSVEVISKDFTLHLKGLTEDVNKSMVKVNEAITQMSLSRKDYAYLEKLLESVKWFYKEGETFKGFSAHTTLKLEQGYNSGNSSFQYHMNGKTYQVEINGDTIEGFDTKDIANTRKTLKRQSLSGEDLSFPDGWTIAYSGETMAKVELRPQDDEFNEIKKIFLSTASKANNKTIEKIYRIENKTLWRKYQVKKEEIEKRNARKDNERRLWHGTDAKTVEIIIKIGHNRSFTEHHVHGWGAYFARDVSYSENDRYSPADTNGVKRLLLNKVLTGDYVKSQAEMRALPMKDEAKSIPYDSAASDTGPNPAVFVMFHDSQVYPEYIVEFKLS